MIVTYIQQSKCRIGLQGSKEWFPLPLFFLVISRRIGSSIGIAIRHATATIIIVQVVLDKDQVGQMKRNEAGRRGRQQLDQCHTGMVVNTVMREI